MRNTCDVVIRAVMRTRYSYNNTVAILGRIIRKCHRVDVGKTLVGYEDEYHEG